MVLTLGFLVGRKLVGFLLLVGDQKSCKGSALGNERRDSAYRKVWFLFDDMV